MALQNKFKRERKGLPQAENLKAIQEKYGHPGIAGRKKKSDGASVAQENPAISAQAPMSKTIRFKVPIKYYTRVYDNIIINQENQLRLYNDSLIRDWIYHNVK